MMDIEYTLSLAMMDIEYTLTLAMIYTDWLWLDLII
jgi:hypothetical protein